MIKKAKIIGILGALLCVSNALANTSVTLAWDPSSGQVAGYKVYCTDTSNNQVITNDVGNVTSATIANLVEGQTYSFSVTAYDASHVESNPSSPLSYTVPLASNPSHFVRSDTSTRGNWHGVYGSEGSWIAGGPAALPSYLSVSASAPTWIWGQNPGSSYAPYSQPNGTNRVASCWYSGAPMDFSFSVSDGQAHTLAMYFLDWTASGRQQTVELIDQTSGSTLDTQTLTAFSSGVYLVWQVSGNVIVRVTPQKVNAVVSGIFLDGMPSTGAKFVTVDATTQGNWNTVYGADGSIIARDSARNAPYATVTVSDQSEWAYSTTDSDQRALWKNDGTARIAGVWYSHYPTTNAFNVSVNITDGGTHRLAVYALDWYNQGRAIQIDVINSATGQILDTRQLQSFSSGQYLVWDVKGTIQLRVSTLAGPNAMLSGIFLGKAPAPI